MKYTARQYGEALFVSLKEKSGAERKAILKKFLSILRRNRDMHSLGLILKEAEERLLKEENIRKVDVESAAPLSENIRKEIENIMRKNILLKERVNPDLLAGIKMLMDGEILIDATAKRRLDKLFPGVDGVYHIDTI